jgi:hypothetical protein
MLMIALRRLTWKPIVAIVAAAMVLGGLICETRAADDPDVCLARIRRADTDPVTCEIVRRATAAERNSLAGWTAGVLLDADCNTRIVIAYQVVELLRKAAGPVDIPGQYVSCRIVTSGGPLMAVFEVGGRVGMANGRATDFEPSIKIKQGVTPALGRLLLGFAANATDVRQGVVTTINDFITGPDREKSDQ